MPPLNRQATLESIHSWWSDSNPPGATINLHTAAKPLMRWMYHRAVLAFIQRNSGLPLAEETVCIYFSYLEDKYVSDLTKSAVLAELERRITSNSVRGPEACKTLAILLSASNRNIVRAALSTLGILIPSSPPCARAAVEAKVLDHAKELLESPDNQVRIGMSRLLAELAFHLSTVEAVLERNFCKQLVALLRMSDPDSELIENVLRALVAITRSPVGAQAAVDEKVLHRLPELLDHLPQSFDSHEEEVYLRTCQILANLAFHSSVLSAIDPEVYHQLSERLSQLWGSTKNMDIRSELFSNLVMTSKGVDDLKRLTSA
ncbi:armadillo-type protein [Mycena crocata]|nr:armadillo-type protein [Mycena crocata]